MAQLDSQQEAFALAVIKYRLQRHKAPIKAAAEEVGYSYIYARSLAADPSIRAKIDKKDKEIERKAVNRLILTKERILEEYGRIALFDPITMYDEAGNLLHIKDMPEDTRRAIASIEYGKHGVKLKAVDKKGALSDLSRVNGMFNDKIAITATFGDIMKDVAQMGGSMESLVDESEEEEDDE